MYLSEFKFLFLLRLGLYLISDHLIYRVCIMWLRLPDSRLELVYELTVVGFRLVSKKPSLVISPIYLTIPIEFLVF